MRSYGRVLSTGVTRTDMHSPYYCCLTKINKSELQWATVEKVDQLGGNPRNGNCLDDRRDDVTCRDTKYLGEKTNGFDNLWDFHRSVQNPKPIVIWFGLSSIYK